MGRESKNEGVLFFNTKKTGTTAAATSSSTVSSMSWPADPNGTPAVVNWFGIPGLPPLLA